MSCLDTLVPMRIIAAGLLFLSAIPAFSQDVKADILAHLKVSKEFTLKVAEAMPADSYDFKLTPPQMSFGESKPASNSKADVIAFMKASFDKAIARVEAVKAKQLSETFKTEEGSRTGLDLLLGMLDHTTHHRASAEMYLRAKGITPPEYMF